MRDPYDILGLKRGASFDEIKAAYRRACKSKHPDMGGSHDEFVELQNAYEAILQDLKRGYQQQHEEAKAGGTYEEGRARTETGGRSRNEREWERTYRDIDDELEELRRAAHAYEDALRAMRARAWQAGDRATWAKLTGQDIFHFLRTIVRSGVKGRALLVAALIGLGSVLADANIVSALVILGSGIGFFFSLALKSDKGGIMSAGLLLFGLMTIWLPPVRAALFNYPLATISVLFCLGLILKFAQQGGIVGLATGGVLALYVIGAIVGDTGRREQDRLFRPQSAKVVVRPVHRGMAQLPKPLAPIMLEPGTRRAPQSQLLGQSPPLPPEPLTLIATKGAVLKFVAGVTYHLKVCTGATTLLSATQGKIALYSADARLGECRSTIEFAMRADSSPYEEIDHTIRACGGDVIAEVLDVRR